MVSRERKDLDLMYLLVNILCKEEKYVQGPYKGGGGRKDMPLYSLCYLFSNGVV